MNSLLTPISLDLKYDAAADAAAPNRRSVEVALLVHHQSIFRPFTIALSDEVVEYGFSVVGSESENGAQAAKSIIARRRSVQVAGSINDDTRGGIAAIASAAE